VGIPDLKNDKGSDQWKHGAQGDRTRASGHFLGSLLLVYQGTVTRKNLPENRVGGI